MYAVYGTGSLGTEVIDLLTNELGCSSKNLLLVDDTLPRTKLFGEYDCYPYKEIPRMRDLEFLIALGEPEYRRAIREKLVADGRKMATFISKRAYIGMKTLIEPGCIVFPYSYIGCKTHLADNVCVHSGAKVESECAIGDNSFISLGAFVGANSTIDENVFIGPNAAIIDHTKIGKHAIIGMSACVLHDVKNEQVCVGNPGRILDKNAERVFK